MFNENENDVFIFIFSFEEAFAILIREIEMIRRDNLTKPSNSFENHHTPTHQRRPSDGFMAPEISNGIAGETCVFFVFVEMFPGAFSSFFQNAKRQRALCPVKQKDQIQSSIGIYQL